MKITKTLTALAPAALLALSAAGAAYADVPSPSVIVGEKAFDFFYFTDDNDNNGAGGLAVIQALNNEELIPIYVKTAPGKVIQIYPSSSLVDPSVLPLVTFYDQNENSFLYAAGDGDRLPGLVPFFETVKITDDDRVVELGKFSIDIQDLQGEPALYKVTYQDSDGNKVTTDYINIDAESELVVKSATYDIAVFDGGKNKLADFKDISTDEENKLFPPVIEEVEEALQVKEVRAINLKQLEVEFNIAITSAEAKKANFAVYKEGALTTNLLDGAGATVVISDDGLKATLTLEDGANFSNYTTANKVVVKKAVGLDADYTDDAVALSDEGIPTVKKVEATGPRQITVTFSEPVKGNITASDLTLDNGELAIDTSSESYNNSECTMKFNTFSNLTEGTHTLKVNAGNLVDYTNYQVQPATKDFTYIALAEAPTLAIKESNETSVTFEASRELTGLVNNSNVYFRHSYNTNANEVDGTAVTNPSGDNKTFKVNFGVSHPFAPGDVNIYFGYDDGTTDNNKVKDAYGNILQPATYTVKTQADSVKPKVLDVAFVDPTKVRVTYSETVDSATATNKDNYTLKDATGTTVAVTSVGFASGSTLVVELTTGTINGGRYTLEIKNVKDTSVSGNVIDTSTSPFTAIDEVAPTVIDLDSGEVGTDGILLNDTNKKILISFSEAMTQSSIEDLINYQYSADGISFSALPAGTTVTASADLKSVTIDLPDDTNYEPGTSKVRIGRVKDAAGNAIQALSTDATIRTNFKLVPSKIEVIAKNQIKLTFDTILTGVIASDFEVDVDGTAAGAAFAAPASIADYTTDTTNNKTYITLQTSDDMSIGIDDGIDWSDNTKKPGVKSAASVAGQDQFGRKINFAFNDTVVEDKARPELADTNPITVIDADSDGSTIDHIKVTFKEKVAAGTVTEDDFTIKGFDVLDAYASTTVPTTSTDRTAATVEDSTTVYVRVLPKVGTNANVTARPEVTIAGGNIKDASPNRNAFSGLSTETVASASATAISGTDLGKLSIIGDGVGKTDYGVTASGALNTNRTNAGTLFVTLDNGATFTTVATVTDGEAVTPTAFDAISASDYIAGAQPKYVYVDDTTGEVTPLSAADGTIVGLTGASIGSITAPTGTYKILAGDELRLTFSGAVDYTASGTDAKALAGVLKATDATGNIDDTLNGSNPVGEWDADPSITNADSVDIAIVNDGTTDDTLIDKIVAIDDATLEFTVGDTETNKITAHDGDNVIVGSDAVIIEGHVK